MQVPASAHAAAGSLTDVGGIRVGHFTDPRRPTGCTVVLFDEPVTAGADYDGSAPGEMLGVMLQPVSPVDRIHGILLTGGGPMGLGAVAGAVQYLETRGVGYNWGPPNVRVPIVVGAVIDDLSLGDGRIRPDPEAALKACEAAAATPVGGRQHRRGCRRDGREDVPVAWPWRDEGRRRHRVDPPRRRRHRGALHRQRRGRHCRLAHRSHRGRRAHRGWLRLREQHRRAAARSGGGCCRRRSSTISRSAPRP